ncbi:MAG: hypothetical protein OXF89_04420 [Rhodospirillaceae bacterium]|nr:hypothetical protein [Rhodospirillaceae bacterium]
MDHVERLVGPVAAAVRLAVVADGLSHHEAAGLFGIDRPTMKKIPRYSAPPGYRRTKSVWCPKPDGITDAILEADADPEASRNQRHTAYPIFKRLSTSTDSAETKVVQNPGRSRMCPDMIGQTAHFRRNRGSLRRGPSVHDGDFRRV